MIKDEVDIFDKIQVLFDEIEEVLIDKFDTKIIPYDFTFDDDSDPYKFFQIALYKKLSDITEYDIESLKFQIIRELDKYSDKKIGFLILPEVPPFRGRVFSSDFISFRCVEGINIVYDEDNKCPKHIWSIYIDFKCAFLQPQMNQPQQSL